MHTSYLPTGQQSRLKELIQMQISSDINPQENQGREHRIGKRDRVGKHYPIMFHIS